MPSEPVFVNETRVQTLLDCTLGARLSGTSMANVSRSQGPWVTTLESMYALQCLNMPAQVAHRAHITAFYVAVGQSLNRAQAS